MVRGRGDGLPQTVQAGDQVIIDQKSLGIIDGFDVEARLVPDEDSSAHDSDCYDNKDIERMTDMTMTMNLHHPKIEKVFELDDTWPADGFIITFGNGSQHYDAIVDVFLSDGEWDAIVATVAERRAVLKAERAQRDAEKMNEAQA